jgi:hypothetical protein
MARTGFFSLQILALEKSWQQSVLDLQGDCRFDRSLFSFVATL